jgi:GAF domain-containing protein/sugar diacid utilization regulator
VEGRYDCRIRQAAEPAGESRILYEIISTVGSSLDLEEVLGAVVRLLTDASGVHACFVYFIEDDGARLVLRAASDPYADLVGDIVLERGEGLAWWVVERREPAFIREGALADPRVKYVPELEEDRFQSLISVPIVARDGRAIGAISMHTEAPREFTEDEVEFLVTSSSLVAGAIENASLYEQTRQRVRELEQLTELGEAVARAESLDELLPGVAKRACRLLDAECCAVYLLDPASEELRLRSSFPRAAEPRATLALSALGSELAWSGRSAVVAVPLVAGDELVGLLHATGTAEVDLARAAANLTAVAIKKIEVIERLTEKNLIKDFFEQLAAGRVQGDLAERAQRLGFEPRAHYVVVAAAPADDALERALKAAVPGSLFDRREDAMRALLRVPPGGEVELLASVRRVHEEHGGVAAIGVSNSCSGVASFSAGFEEAGNALLGTTVVGGEPSVLAYDDLGPYKYLLRMSLDRSHRDVHREAVARLADYDRERSTFLLYTLEEFLRRHGNISATAAALYVHPNTLRQRLRRVMEISGLDLRKDDWLMVEIAVKMAKLEQALGTDVSDIPRARRL